MFELGAVVWFLGVGVWLSIIDIREHRLPNRLIVFGLAGCLTLFTLAAAAESRWSAFGGALLGGAGMFAWYGVLALITRGGIGAGDVKLAALVGLVTGWFGLEVWLLALWLAFVIGGVAALALRLSRRLARSAQLAFGPAMIASAGIALLSAAIGKLSPGLG